MATLIERIRSITSLTAHYITPSGIRRTKDFTGNQPVDSYLKWKKSVERMGYTIECLDTFRDERVGVEFTEFVGPVQMRSVTNLMSGRQVWERMDLPYSCSVGSETYWSS
jgi:hypothetical protein